MSPKNRLGSILPLFSLLHYVQSGILPPLIAKEWRRGGCVIERIIVPIDRHTFIGGKVFE